MLFDAALAYISAEGDNIPAARRLLLHAAADDNNFDVNDSERRAFRRAGEVSEVTYQLHDLAAGVVVRRLINHRLADRENLPNTLEQKLQQRRWEVDVLLDEVIAAFAADVAFMNLASLAERFAEDDEMTFSEVIDEAIEAYREAHSSDKND